MKDIFKILSDAGVELTDEQKSTIKTDIADNYRAKADYDKVVAKRDEYKASLDDVSEKLEKATEGDASLKEEITNLKNQLEEEKSTREKETARRELEGRVDAFLDTKEEDGTKKYDFVNEITRNSIRNSLMDELEKETSKGVSADEIFAKLTSDDEGKPIAGILVDKTKKKLEEKKIKFTRQMNGSGAAGDDDNRTTLRGMSIEERMTLKSENPDLYESLRKN